jgi:hypothetical protein
MSIGFLAELFTAYTVRDVETYSIKETTVMRLPDPAAADAAAVEEPVETSESTSS